MTAAKFKTHCPQGHPYDEENTYINRGKRYCKQCAWHRLNVRRKAKNAKIQLLKILGPKDGQKAYEEYLRKNGVVKGRRGLRDRTTNDDWVESKVKEIKGRH